MGYIYIIKNIKNNKVYIGITSRNVQTRWKEHIYKLNKKSHENKLLQKDWNKYGKDMFIFEILKKCDYSKLEKNENFYINKYKSTNKKFGYNNKSEGYNGGMTDAVKEKISLSVSGEKHPNHGKKLSKETKIKISNSHRGIKFSKEHKENLSKSHIGNKSRAYSKNKKATSKYFGIYLRTIGDRKVFAIVIKTNGKIYRLGFKENEIDAAKAYDKFVKDNSLDKPLNFPSDI